MPLTLVTGASGWLGTQLVQNLVNGFPDIPALKKPAVNQRLRCLVQPGTDPARLKGISGEIEVCQGDLQDPAAMQVFCREAAGATLFHCAGLIHPRSFVKELYRVNVTGTGHLLRAAEKAGVKRIVVMSSNSPIGTNASPDDVFSETSGYRPYMNYGRSKMQMEMLVKEMQQRGRMETVIVRSPWFYGPFQPERQTLFFHMIRDGKAPLLGSGENRRSMAYVENISQGMVLCANSEAANGQIFWIADAAPYTMNEIIATVEKLLEEEFSIPVRHKRLRLPYITGEIATCADGLIQGLGFYNQKIHVLSEMNKTIACSIAKAREQLGYDPKIALEEGMRRSLQWVLAAYGRI